jgi:hypothetical protein
MACVDLASNVVWKNEASFANIYLLYCSSFLFTLYPITYTVKKVSDFPIPSRNIRMSGRRDAGKGFPARESLVSDIQAGDGKIANLFLQCMDAGIFYSILQDAVFMFLFVRFFKSLSRFQVRECGGIFVPQRGKQ